MKAVCVAPSVPHPSPLVVSAVSWAYGFFCYEEVSMCCLTLWHCPVYVALTADSGEWRTCMVVFRLSGTVCSGDSREVKQLSAVPSSGLPLGDPMQSLWFCWWDLNAESTCRLLRQQPACCDRGELCCSVPGGAGLAGLHKSWAPASFRLCRGLQCQSWECFCTQIIWKALFIVLVLFKNVYTLYVILKKTVYTKYFVS